MQWPEQPHEKRKFQAYNQFLCIRKKNTKAKRKHKRNLRFCRTYMYTPPKSSKNFAIDFYAASAHIQHKYENWLTNLSVRTFYNICQHILVIIGNLF